MAEMRCTGSISKMEFLTSTLPAAVASAKEEILSGVLRNSRGTKVRNLDIHILHFSFFVFLYYSEIFYQNVQVINY